MQENNKKSLTLVYGIVAVSTMHPISASAATKKVDLKTPVIYNWKKNRRWTLIVPPVDGVEYTVTWSIRIPG